MVLQQHGEIGRLCRSEVVVDAWNRDALNVPSRHQRVVVREIGTEIEIGQLDGQQKRLKARVVPFPHFDPKKERVKGNYD